MAHYPYLIVGGGMAAHAAIKGIRKVDNDKAIGMVGMEHSPPYKRPPLTKGLWKGDPFDSIWYPSDMPGVEFRLGRRVVQLDLVAHAVLDDRGDRYSFDKLLLATGGTPRRLGLAADDDIIYYRTVADYQRLRLQAEAGQKFAVIGAGFIGSELAAVLAMNGKQVSMIMRGEAIADAMLPPDEARFLNQYYEQRSVHLSPRTEIVDVTHKGARLVLTTRRLGGEEQTDEVDAIVAGLGITPNTELARAAGLKVDDGVVVDAGLRSSHPDVYVAGDAASFYNPALNKYLRVEHEDNALKMGESAGQAMAHHLAGEEAAPYHHLPFFYSDLFDIGYEAVGQVDAQLETVAFWQTPHGKGIIYYLRDGQVRGALMWNIFKQVDAARQLIAEEGPFEADDLAERVPLAGKESPVVTPAKPAKEEKT
jgi:NADPH-dependent 2,4-dienoyl-CoA reductase/sulfur reductase-like enzyme